MVPISIGNPSSSKGDQKDAFKRVPITAKLVTNLLKKAGVSNVMIIEPHTPQLEGFFDTPVDALKVIPQSRAATQSVRLRVELPGYKLIKI